MKVGCQDRMVVSRVVLATKLIPYAPKGSSFASVGASMFGGLEGQGDRAKLGLGVLG